MSIMAESNVYESMADDGLNEKLCLAACETSGAFMFIPKIERNVEEAMQRGISEEIIGEKGGILYDGIIQDTYNSMEEPPIYYEEALSACEEVEVDYKPSLSSMMLPVNKMDENWEEANQFNNSPMDSSFEDNQVVMTTYNDESENMDDSDEETIATFLTSAGQRLALYAVEDSDEVFAVAVYNESGEPPTNFQFLMKADVERLIGEGAVRTVKKPTQMKKQLFSTDPPVFEQHTEEIEVKERVFEQHTEEIEVKERVFEQHTEEIDVKERVFEQHTEEIEVKESVFEQHTEEIEVKERSVTESSIEEPSFDEPSFEETSFEETSFEETSFEEPSFEEIPLKSEFVESSQYQNNQYNTHNITYSDDNNLCTTEMVQEEERISSPLPTVDKQQEFTYVLMDSTFPVLATDEIEEKPEPVKTTPDIDNNHSEFIEQSTVQYILLDEDSNSELTLADIEETLKNHKPIIKNKSLLKNSNKISVDITEDHQNLNGALLSDLMRDDLQNIDIPVVTENNSPKSLNLPIKSYKTAYSGRKTSSLICRRENFIDERLNVSSGTSLLISNSEAKNSELKTPSENVQTGSRVKRSRKQQLISVNRDDSEIIIQPASFGSEDDEPMKKRGRGRRKSGRPPIYKKTGTPKKIHRSLRPRPVEVIEIDVDEADRLQGKKDIEEITIDENKEKGSSDKENEVIMVGDSEDEAEEAAKSKSSTSLLKCNHCLRSFRQKRALETHSRVCPKSPESLRRLSEKTARRNSTRSNDSSAVKKSYACKICQETFDVVVVLARHVRAMHSQKKKVNSGNHTTARAKTPESPSTTEEISRNSVTSETDTNVTIDSPRRKTKTKIKASKRSWKSKKLHCDDCGRWFTSNALLTAHSLQHATKKSEKQMRRCATCKKLFNSRLLYIRHMRMHSKAKQLQKKLHHTRQATGKTTAVRKRGRPRKL